jgi:hypothetical protein
MNDQARNRLSQIMTKCNQGEKSLTPQETTIITLLAILNHSLIDRKQIQTSIPYIDQLTEKVQAIKEACKAENQSIPDVDQVVKELDVLCSLQFRSKRTPGFQLDKRLKRTLTKLALSMERLGQETEDLQQLYFSEPSKRPFVQHPALANFLSEENRNIFTLRGFSQIEIPYYQRQPWRGIPIHQLYKTPRWENYPVVQDTKMGKLSAAIQTIQKNTRNRKG